MASMQNTTTEEILLPISYDHINRERLFDSFFVEGDEIVLRLKKQALGCELLHSSLRVLSWRMFLGVLSTPPRAEEWLKEITAQRSEFSRLKTKYANWKNMDEEIDPNLNNPLSLDEKSPWSVFFENERLHKFITQDVERIYPEYEYFQQKWVQEFLIEILFIYTKENPEVPYAQGMHDVLAPIIYILDKEKLNITEGSILSKLMDTTYIEHDAYIIFEKIMRTIGSWFQMSKDKTPDSDSPVIQKSNFIFHKLLKSRDPGLYSYLLSLNIVPQVFLLRWIRILFGREFSLEETLILWDAIFSYDKNFSLVDYIAVSMLIAIKEQLLNSDQNGALQLFFKYPNCLPISTFVNDAVNMIKSKPKSNPNSGGSVQLPNNQNRISSVSSPTSRIPFPKPPSNSSPSSPPQTSPTPNQMNSAELELNQLKDFHTNIAVRLEDIVNTLQHKLLPVVTELPSSDSILISLAELKQIKDVMRGHLSLDALTLSE